MNDSQPDNEIEIISETVTSTNINDNSSTVLNQAVKRKLRQQFPSLEMAGKKIKVVSSQGGKIDPSRMKILSITRVPLKSVSETSVRHFSGRQNNNDSTSDKENTAPGGSIKVSDRKGLFISSDPSFFSVSSNEDQVSSEPRPDQQRLCHSSSLDLLSLSSDENDDRASDRSLSDTLGSSNNNNSQRSPKERLDRDRDANRSPKDAEITPDLNIYLPLDAIKTRLAEKNLCSESFMNTCQDLNMKWIRLDKNWNVEISSSALGMAFGADFVDQIISQAPVYNQSGHVDNLQSLSDEGHEVGTTDNHQEADEDKTDDELEDVTSGNNVNPGPSGDSETWSTAALLNWGEEAGDSHDELDTQEESAVSPPALYHTPREEMTAILGLITQEQAREIR